MDFEGSKENAESEYVTLTPLKCFYFKLFISRQSETERERMNIYEFTPPVPTMAGDQTWKSGTVQVSDMTISNPAT